MFEVVTMLLLVLGAESWECSDCSPHTTKDGSDCGSTQNCQQNCNEILYCFSFSDWVVPFLNCVNDNLDCGTLPKDWSCPYSPDDIYIRALPIDSLLLV